MRYFWNCFSICVSISCLKSFMLKILVPFNEINLSTISIFDKRIWILRKWFKENVLKRVLPSPLLSMRICILLGLKSFKTSSDFTLSQVRKRMHKLGAWVGNWSSRASSWVARAVRTPWGPKNVFKDILNLKPNFTF